MKLDEHIESHESSPPRAAVLSLGAPLFRLQVLAMREMHGEPAFEQALERLSPEVRQFAEAPPALGWVPFSTVEAVASAMAETLGQPVEAFQLSLVRATTAKALRGVWRLLGRLSSREALIRRASTYWRKTWSHGHVDWVSDQDGKLTCKVSQLLEPSEYMLRGVAFSVQALFEHVGRTGISVRWTRTATGADYSIQWSSASA